jgi:hypothetical protein
MLLLSFKALFWLKVELDDKCSYNCKILLILLILRFVFLFFITSSESSIKTSFFLQWFIITIFWCGY